MTLSLFCAHRPRRLFAKLKERGAEITPEEPGIYGVSGLLGVAAQVVVEDQLVPGTHASLRLLLKPPALEDYREIGQVQETLQDQDDWNNFKAVMQTSYQANYELFERLKEERDMNVKERLHRGFPELFEEAIQKGIAINRAETAVDMLREHLPMDLITRIAKMSPDNIMELARSAGLEPAT